MAPYIVEEDRTQYNKALGGLLVTLRLRDFPVGEVTYLIYRLLLAWWDHNRSYQTICEIRGVLVGSMAEFDRRESSMYEREKCETNGDV
jgi:hypothetical protein